MKKQGLFLLCLIICVTLVACTALLVGCSKEEVHTHDFDEWEITLKPTCTEKGARIRTCDCGETEKGELDATGKHVYGVDNTCTACGLELVYTKELNFHLNDGGESWTVAMNEYSDIDVVIIPESYNGKPVTTIGFRAFYYCENLTTVTIPSSINTIGHDAFYECPSLAEVHISDLLSWMSINFQSHPCSAGATLLLNGSPLTDLVIPDGAESVGTRAFLNVKEMRSVEIPKSVKSIEEAAFSGCTSLSSLTIPSSVTSIGYCAFGSCTSLTLIKIPDSVTSIGVGAFGYCSGLTSITIPDSVTGMGNNAFSNCSNLEWADLSEGLKYIPDGAFAWCPKLASVIIPKSITSIGTRAFYDCSSLAEIYYEGSESDWSGVSIADKNDDLHNATVYFYSKNRPDASGNYWHYVNGVPTVW